MKSDVLEGTSKDYASVEDVKTDRLEIWQSFYVDGPPGCARGYIHKHIFTSGIIGP